jgi:hypothetical protein
VPVHDHSNIELENGRRAEEINEPAVDAYPHGTANDHVVFRKLSEHAAALQSTLKSTTDAIEAARKANEEERERLRHAAQTASDMMQEALRLTCVNRTVAFYQAALYCPRNSSDGVLGDFIYIE